MSGMAMSRGRFVLSLALVVAVLTTVIGWWSPFLLGGAGGWLVGRSTAAVFAPGLLAGALAWAALLGLDLVLGEGGRAAAALGATLGIGGFAAVAATVAFSALATGCSAVAGRVIRVAGARSRVSPR